MTTLLCSTPAWQQFLTGVGLGGLLCVSVVACIWIVCAVCYHHGFVHSKVRQQHVVLHDVAGDLPEGAKISGLTVDQNFALHPRFPAHTAIVRPGPGPRPGPEPELELVPSADLGLGLDRDQDRDQIQDPDQAWETLDLGPGSGSGPGPGLQQGLEQGLHGDSCQRVDVPRWVPNGRTHLYPARMFMRVDFPAPEGPMMATSSPLVKRPEIPLSRVLYPEKEGKA